MSILNEGLNFKDMVGLIKPTLFIDEFSSKIADDDQIAVLSFYVRSSQVADDLINWFEKGYEYVLDSDRSPGEVAPNRYLVFVEIERRTRLIQQIKELLEDLETLTEHKLKDWIITHDDKEIHYNPEQLEKMLDLSPHVYRLNHQEELQETADLDAIRTAANLPIKKRISRDKNMDLIRSQAGLL